MFLKRKGVINKHFWKLIKDNQSYGFYEEYSKQFESKDDIYIEKEFDTCYLITKRPKELDLTNLSKYKGVRNGCKFDLTDKNRFFWDKNTDLILIILPYSQCEYIGLSIHEIFEEKYDYIDNYVCEHFEDINYFDDEE